MGKLMIRSRKSKSTLKKPTRKSTFRSATPVGRGTISPEYVKALKQVKASQDLIDWAEEKANGRLAGGS
ncbi:MAG: hypothetical protein ABR507_09110 [Actinomycetota bacterium]|nr:hypothetical protein [Actinomycetota bacterium]